MREEDQQRLTRSALLHDIGKAQIPRAILQKPSRLTEGEMAIMRTHPSLGQLVLQRGGTFPEEVLSVARHHHEYLDGSGYPAGLRGAAIPDAVRIITICDIFGALIERRAYRAPMDPMHALQVLADMNDKLDGDLVRAFALTASALTDTACRSVPDKPKRR